MTPYVIDNQQRKHYIYIFILGLFLSFLLGYFLGIQQDQFIGSPVVDADRDNTSLIEDGSKIPVTTAMPDSKKDIKGTAKSEADKNKKQAATESKSDKKTKDKSVKKKSSDKKISAKKPEREKSKKVVKTSKKSDIKSPVKKPVKKAPAKAREVKVVAKPKPEKLPVETTDSNLEKVSTEAKEKTASMPPQYSVQVGMFSGKDNAQKYVDELKGSSMQAYASEFVSTAGSIKYNVRLGPFPSRDAAREKLAEFKKHFTTPAYIVINK